LRHFGPECDLVGMVRAGFISAQALKCCSVAPVYYEVEIYYEVESGITSMSDDEKSIMKLSRE
jgi:hypothetical protein